MEQFFNWLSATPIAGTILISIVVISVLVLIVTYLVAFYQGREISFWPPKLGAKPLHSVESGTAIQDSVVSKNLRDRLDTKETSIFGVKKPGDGINYQENYGTPSQPGLQSFRLQSRPIAVLVGTDGLVNGTMYAIVTGHRDVTVGRGSSCDLPINSNLLSRHHFRIRVSLAERAQNSGRGFFFELIDSGSTNGTFLNGKRIIDPNILGNGSLIEAGDCGFRFFALTAPVENGT